VFILLDLNEDNKLEYNEFIGVFQDTNNMNDEIMVEYIFTQIDKDNSGVISKSEIRKFFMEKQISLKNNELNDMIKRLDSDGNSNVSIYEFKQLMIEELQKGRV